MRVLHVLGELRPSGGEVMLRDAVSALRDHGMEPVVLSTGEHLGEFANEYHRLSVETLHLPFSRDFHFADSFMKLIRNTDVRVVHIHTERANAALGFIARFTGARVVRTVHSVFTYTGRLRVVRIIERAALRAIGVQHISIGPSVERNESLRFMNATRLVDNWIGPRFRPPSPAERVNARKLFALDADTISITTIGNCSSIKNHRALLEALPAISGGLCRPITYLHAGSGSVEPEEREVAAMLAKAGLRVRFLGSVSDVLPLLWASDIYCMPSLYEGVGIAALEALACGVPSVLADVPGLRDVHDPAPTVKFVAPSAPQIARDVLELVRSPTQCAASAREVASRIRACRRMEDKVEVLVGIYREG